MSAAAERLSKKTKQTIAGVTDPIQKGHSTIKKVLKALFYGRVGITLILLIWVSFISYRLVRSNTIEEDTIQEDTDKYFYLHRVWFGEESVLMIIFNMWYYSFILLILYPIIGWLSDVLKLYLAGGRLLG